MNTRIRSICTKRRLLFLVMTLLLVTGLVYPQAPQTANAWIDDDPHDPVDPIGDPAWEAPTDGFTWGILPRYGPDYNHDGMVDTFWMSDEEKYSETYIFPENWTVNFEGCQTQGDVDNPTSTTNSYTWQIVGQSNPFADGHSCAVRYDFPAQDTYTVRLTVHDPAGNIVPAGKTNPEYFQQAVTIRDIFIVALGDSYGSGEGNPDIQQVVRPRPWPIPGWDLIHEAVWQDERCHRSAFSGSSLAAMALEYADPHTSVTYISFACSGATLQTETWKDWDPNKPLGSGILGSYYGAVDVGVSFSQDHDTPPYYAGYIKPQIVALEQALIPRAGKPARQIDALIISAGGNDIHFFDILAACLGYEDCWRPEAKIPEGPYNATWYALFEIIDRALGHWASDGPAITLPGSYDDLHSQIALLQPAPPAHVYLTQYPDQTRDGDGTTCDVMLEDAFWPPLPFTISQWEAWEAARVGLKPLNDHIREAAERYATEGWRYVDGLASYDADPEVSNKPQPGLFVSGHDGQGHGYCASNNWIRRAEEAELIQGPVNARPKSSGTMHPNVGGHMAYKERLLRYMIPDLQIQQPQAPPAFSFSYSLAGYTDVASETTGWYLESCNGSVCQPKVVAQAVATSSTNLVGAGVSANDVAGCAIAGVSCQIPDTGDAHRVTYDVEITASGTYRFRFFAQDSSGQISSLEREIRVDLEGPVLATPIGPFAVQEGGTVMLTASATSPGEAVFNYDWDLDRDGIFEVTDEEPSFSAADIDGPDTQDIQVRVTDRAGRTATGQARVNVSNVAPAPEIRYVPESAYEGTAIVLGSSVIDPGVDDTFSYDWSVTYDRIVVASGSNADFSFTPDDSGPYAVALIVWDDDGGAGMVFETIDVLNVAPTAAILDAPASSNEGTAINLNGSATDPGAADTLYYTWTAKKNGSTVATGAGTSFSFTPDDNGSYEVSLKVEDDDDGVATTSRTIEVLNVAPTAAISGAPETSPEGTAINLGSSVSDPGTADTFTTYAWTVEKNGSNFATGAGTTISFTPDDNGAYDVSLTVTDDDGGVGTAIQTITVENVAPVLSDVTVSPGAVNEGGSVTLGGSISDAGSADTFALTINWGDGSTPELVSLPAGSTSFSRSHTYADDNPVGTASDTNAIAISIADDDGAIGSASASVVVDNLAPSLSILAPESGALYAVNATVDVSASLTDPSSLDTLTCSVNWNDGTTGPGTVAAGVCTANHVYTAAGVYTIQMTGTDDDTGAKSESVMVVVYDPSGGFVTGGGWINSPAGAYKMDESLSGKATFGFVSRYQKGASVPTGNTAFQFQVGGLEFYSTAYEWLVVNVTGTNAQFKGSGLINGTTDPNGNAYKFMIRAGDGSPDTFRIRIWWEGADAVEHDVYDNGTDQAIGAGNIVVHTSK